MTTSVAPLDAALLVIVIFITVLALAFAAVALIAWVRRRWR
jgi:hypothetical protein